MSKTEQQLREIDAIAVEVLDVSTRQDAKEKAGSRREAYGKALDEVRDVAGRSAAGELLEWVQEQIRTEETFPTSREVRKQGAKICRSMDHSIPDDSWLGA
ncbi:hypothetical protein [Haloparvum sp. AD34]